MATVDADRFDRVGFVIAYENDELDNDEIIDGFQTLIDTGVAWQLQGSYGRTAAALIEQGYCTPAPVSEPLEPGVGPDNPKPEKVGTHCECGANYVYLKRHNRWGYECAR